MNIIIMGTGAYERVPAMFCTCPACENARKTLGKDVRTQSQTLINDEILLDFGQDNYIHYLSCKKDYTKLKAIIITHSHIDHYVSSDFAMTGDWYGHNHITQPIKVFGNEECFNEFNKVKSEIKCEFNVINAYETAEFDKYKITALPAHHGTEKPNFYIINDGEKTILYSLDTALVKDEVYDFIKENNFKIDTVFCDCTGGVNDVDCGADTGACHMTIYANEIHREKLIKTGAISADTQWVITHLSHNGLVENEKAVTHEDMASRAKERGMICAYDGMELNI